MSELLREGDKVKFWSKVMVIAVDDCWIWSGSMNSQGYGQMKVGEHYVRAHRLSWMIHHGAIPEGKMVCHHCDVPMCVNPKHLFIGTSKDNMQDMARKGRNRHPTYYGEEHPRSKLTITNVRDIRARLQNYSWGLYRALGREYGVDKETIRNIDRGINWRTIN